MASRGALFLVTSLLLGSCGGSAPNPTPVVAGVAELGGPYRTEPFQAFDPDLVTLLRDACLSSLAVQVRLAQGLEPALVDSRGGGRFLLLLAAEDGEAACIGRLDTSGTPSIEGGSSGGGPALIEPREIIPVESGSGSDVDPWQYVTGLVGSEIGGVVLQLADGSRVTASIGDGRYAAWWPGAQQVVRIQGYDRNGALVADTPNAP